MPVPSNERILAVMRQCRGDRMATAHKLGLTIAALEHRIRRARAAGYVFPRNNTKLTGKYEEYLPTPEQIAAACAEIDRKNGRVRDLR